MVTVRFTNETDKPLELMIEPWGASEFIPAGSNFEIYYVPPTDRLDTSHAEVHDRLIRFWCEGDAYAVDVDGVRIQT